MNPMKIKESRSRNYRMATKGHRFLGLDGYYRRFTKNFSKIAKPLTTWIPNGKIQTRNASKNQHSKKLKPIICSALILSLPKGIEDFVV